MPSEGRWTWLRSQGLGVCCGLATVVLLAIGSFVLAATRGGASAGIGLDDVLPFFERPAWAHLWFYALLPVLTLYGINTFLATWHSVTTKWRNGVRDPRRYAAAFFHVGFLVALLAHLIGGVGGSIGAMPVDADWRGIPGGLEIRLVGTDVERLPDGTPKMIFARVETRAPGGEPQASTIAYNRPLSSGLGANLVLLQRPTMSTVAVLTAGEERCALHMGDVCSLAGLPVRLLEVRDAGPHGTLARVAVGESSTWLMRGIPVALNDGAAVVLREVEARPAALVTLRRAPGNGVALVSALFLTLGVVLMARKIVGMPPRRTDP